MDSIVSQNCSWFHVVYCLVRDGYHLHILWLRNMEIADCLPIWLLLLLLLLLWHGHKLLAICCNILDWLHLHWLLGHLLHWLLLLVIHLLLLDVIGVVRITTSSHSISVSSLSCCPWGYLSCCNKFVVSRLELGFHAFGFMESFTHLALDVSTFPSRVGFACSCKMSASSTKNTSVFS